MLAAWNVRIKSYAILLICWLLWKTGSRKVKGGGDRHDRGSAICDAGRFLVLPAGDSHLLIPGMEGEKET